MLDSKNNSGQQHPPGFDWMLIGVGVIAISHAVAEAFQEYMQNLYIDAMAQTLAVLAQ